MERRKHLHTRRGQVSVNVVPMGWHVLFRKDNFGQFSHVGFLQSGWRKVGCRQLEKLSVVREKVCRESVKATRDYIIASKSDQSSVKWDLFNGQLRRRLSAT